MIDKLKNWLGRKSRREMMIEGFNAWYSPRYYFVSRGYVWLRLDSSENIERCKIVDIAV